MEGDIQRDEIWVPIQDIICVTKAPTANGRRYVMDEQDEIIINELFTEV